MAWARVRLREVDGLGATFRSAGAEESPDRDLARVEAAAPPHRCLPASVWNVSKTVRSFRSSPDSRTRLGLAYGAVPLVATTRATGRGEGDPARPAPGAIVVPGARRGAGVAAGAAGARATGLGAAARDVADIASGAPPARSSSEGRSRGRPDDHITTEEQSAKCAPSTKARAPCATRRAAVVDPSTLTHQHSSTGASKLRVARRVWEEEKGSNAPRRFRAPQRPSSRARPAPHGARQAPIPVRDRRRVSRGLGGAPAPAARAFARAPPRRPGMVAAGAWRENGLVALPVALRASRGRASRAETHAERILRARGSARRGATPASRPSSASSSASSERASARLEARWDHWTCSATPRRRRHTPG